MTKPIAFSKKFMWGVSTSAHQVEGGNTNQWSVWELENAKSLAARAVYHYEDLPNWPSIARQAKRPDNYVSGKAVDHYRLFREDFDLVKKLQMNTFRFSIEWSRIEPEEGAWSKDAIKHYHDYFDELSKREITPVVTLFHFTLPIWFTEKGGFEYRKNVRYFTRFVEKVIDEFGKDIKWIITINEPDVYVNESYLQHHWPPAKNSRAVGLKVLENLILAHKQAAKLIHAKNRRFKVSMAYNISYNFGGDDSVLSQWSANRLQNLSHYTLWRTKASIDFIGLNYYFSNRVYGYRVHNPDQRVSDLGWDMQPGDLRYVLEDLTEQYQKPILITENGLADAKDEHRQWWLAQTIQAMQAAIGARVDLLGYIHWSLLDNFEWDKGTWPKFGLFEVDYKTMKRTPRKSAIALARTLKSIRSKA